MDGRTEEKALNDIGNNHSSSESRITKQTNETEREVKHMWKIGVIGAGYWSQKHLNAWTSIDGVSVEGICDFNLEQAEQRAEQFNLANDICFQDINDMLASTEIDVIDIITPPETHVELVGIAAKHGKHIMCQKPFARSIEEAKKIIHIAEEAGVRLMVTENWRWLEPFQKIKTLLEEEKVGKIHSVRYSHTDFYSPRFGESKPLPQPFFRDMPKLLFYEMGVHWFDTWRFLFGEPKRLYAEHVQISPYVKGEDSGFISIAHEDFIGLMDMSWATRRELETALSEPVLPDHKEQLSVEGDLGTIKLYKNGTITFINNDGMEETLVEHTEINYEESHIKLQRHFIECLNTGAKFQTSARDNLKTLQLVFATYQSADEHEVVHFNVQ